MNGNELQDQGEQLLLGLTNAILAVTGSQDHFDRGRVVEAVANFNSAWGAGSWADIPLPRVPDGEFKAYWDALEGKQTSGFWVVWDLIRHLKGNGDTGSPSSLPILIYRNDEPAVVATLFVELTHNGGTGLHPDPCYMGLTAFDGPFRDAVNLAWRVAGMDQCGCRGRWWVTGFRRPDSEERDSFGLPHLSGRSAGAAFSCALWAALGHVPGDDSYEPPLELDPRAAVTARLDDDDCALKTKLGEVHGVPEKLKAAREVGLTMVLVAKDQPEPDYEDHRKEHPDDPVLVGTIGDAFRELLFAQQVVRAHHKHVQDEWESQWSEVIGGDGE